MKFYGKGLRKITLTEIKSVREELYLIIKYEYMNTKRLKKKRETSKDSITFKVHYNNGSASVIVHEDSYYANHMKGRKLKCRQYTYNIEQ